MPTPAPLPDYLNPYHFCTYFDRNYLTRGLALYHSLKEHSKRPFVLWTLCFDDESHAILSGLGLDGMRLIRHCDFVAGDMELVAARANRSLVEYYWTCTPSLPLYVLCQNDTIDLITYLDADLFFYSDPQTIFDELGGGSILIHGHRFAPVFAHKAKTAGIYNVGLLAFRRDHAGLECLQWWRSRCNEWCYARAEDGKYGDQKYLDDWPVRFHAVVVLQHPGAGLAPWNITRYRLDPSNCGLQVDGHELIFFHFHGLKVLNNAMFQPSGGYRFPYTAYTEIFLPYLQSLRLAAYEAGLPFADTIAVTSFRQRVRGLFLQDILLNRDSLLTRVVWRLGERNRKALQFLGKATQSTVDGQRKQAGRLILEALRVSPLILFTRPFLTSCGWLLLGQASVVRLKRIFG